MRSSWVLRYGFPLWICFIRLALCHNIIETFKSKSVYWTFLGANIKQMCLIFREFYTHKGAINMVSRIFSPPLFNKATVWEVSKQI